MSDPKAGAAAFADELERVVAELGIDVDPAARAKMLAHYELLTRWNRRLNLTRIRDPRQSARLHFGESLFLARECGLEAESIVDLGSGAGFPGLPIAAWKPETRLTLVESVGKKAVFLSEVCREWPNAAVWNERMEALKSGFDWAVARAVAPGEMAAILPRITRRAAILTGPDGARVLETAGGLRWEAPRRSPWGRERLLLIGEAGST